MKWVRQNSAIVVIFALVPTLFAVTAIMVPGFMSDYSLRALMTLSAILGLASVGQTMTVIVGGLDLSIPAVIAMSVVSMALLHESGWSSWLIVLFILSTAIIIGIVNGLLSYFLSAPSLVVTLATGSVVTGATLAISNGGIGGSVPSWVSDTVSLTSTSFGLPIPPIVGIWAIVIVGVLWFERRTVAARRLYATGMSPEASRFTLIRVHAVWAATFGASAFFAALTGIFLAGFSGGANVSAGDPYLFLTIAAVVVGGTSLLGGSGSYARTVMGAILMQELATLLLGLGFGTEMQLVCLGLLIVALVALYGRTPHVSNAL